MNLLNTSNYYNSLFLFHYQFISLEKCFLFQIIDKANKTQSLIFSNEY